jgi:hypothetical protein
MYGILHLLLLSPGTYEVYPDTKVVWALYLKVRTKTLFRLLGVILYGTSYSSIGALPSPVD